MKALGIVRKIDDLGRVVIPKEVRDTQGWKSGQALELFISNEGLVLKGYRGGEEKEKAIKVVKKALEAALYEEDALLVSELEEVIKYLGKK